MTKPTREEMLAAADKAYAIFVGTGDQASANAIMQLRADMQESVRTILDLFNDLTRLHMQLEDETAQHEIAKAEIISLRQKLSAAGGD